MLLELMKKYGTDKMDYAMFYESLFRDKRESIKKVLELGIGHPTTMRHIKSYKTGASLRVWKDYFPNAQIYGADVLPEALFQGERINTFLCDERKPEDLKSLIKNTGSDIDLFIDDASHDVAYQLYAFRCLMPLLDKKVVYIIEDISRFYIMIKYLEGYNYTVSYNENFIIITNK